MKQTNKGFTLIELMIVIAIIGTLAAVGYPSYRDSVTKSNRADAINALLAEAGRMEEFYMNNDTYTAAAVAVANAVSKDGLYNMSVTVPAGGFSYTLTATPVSPDPECTTLTLDSLGQKDSTPPGSTCW